MKNRRTVFFWAAVYICTATFIFFRSKAGFFTADDFYYLETSSRMGLWDLISSRQAIGYYFRPLTAASFVLDYRLWSFNFSGYILFNIASHLAVSLTVMLFCYEYNKVFEFKESSVFFSGAVGFFFLILPAHSGAIFWIAARSGLLMTLFGLLCLLFSLQYSQTRKIPCLVLAVCFFILALAAKEAAVVFILALLILDYVYTKAFGKRYPPKRPILTAAPFAAALILFFAVRCQVIGHLAGGPYVTRGFHLNLLKYAENMFKLPIRSFLPPIDSSLSLAAALIILAVLLYTVLFFFRGGGHRPPILKPWGIGLLLLLFVFLLPYLQFGVNLGDVNRERYLYLISVPALMLLGNGLAAVFRARPKLAGFLAVLLAVIYIPYFFNALETWKTAGSLARDIVSQTCAYSDREKIIFVNMPVSYKGAYVLPLGLEPALPVFCKAEGVRILELSHHYLTDLQSGLEITADGDVSSYRLVNKKDKFTYNVWAAAEKAKLGGYSILEKSRGEFKVKHGRTDPTTVIVYFQAGKVCSQDL